MRNEGYDWLRTDTPSSQLFFFAGFCKYQKVDFLDYFVTGSLQSLLCLLKVFSLHQYVVGVIG